MVFLRPPGYADAHEAGRFRESGGDGWDGGAAHALLSAVCLRSGPAFIARCVHDRTASDDRVARDVQSAIDDDRPVRAERHDRGGQRHLDDPGTCHGAFAQVSRGDGQLERRARACRGPQRGWFGCFRGRDACDPNLAIPRLRGDRLDRRDARDRVHLR
jgi:hypothetical protein